MLSAVGIGLRAFLLLVGSVVLGLSITLSKHQVTGPVPSETGFSSFAGACGILVSVAGLAALWFDSIQGGIIMGMDALASMFYLAAGIALTIAMKGVTSCTATDDVTRNHRVIDKILSGGCIEFGDNIQCPYAFDDHSKDITPARCQVAQADYVFEFMGFIFGLAMVVLGFILARRGGTAAVRANNV